MAVFKHDNYQGEILYDNKCLTFGAAGLCDAAELAEMYAAISITKDNYTTKLDPSSHDNFRNNGGMFIVHNQESIEKELKCGESFFAVIRTEKHGIVASFWVSKNDSNLNNTHLFSGEPKMVEALNEKLVLFPRELIVTSKYRIPMLAPLMFYTIFSVMQSNGYTHSLGEVYGVHSFSMDGKSEVIDMLNERSFNMVQATGGVCIGSLPYRELSVEQLFVTIESRIFRFDYDVMLPALKKKLDKNGITVIFKEAGA